MQKNHLINFWKQSFKFRDDEIESFKRLNREDFIPNDLKLLAYQDTPLPLIRGKTISQPTTVMIMTAALDLRQGENVFEVGTGSGYQAAIISNLVGPTGIVTSTEIIPELVNQARTNLTSANINNVNVYEEDGSKGMIQVAPFDKIIITAACKEIPKPLIEQLKIGGVLIGPVGDKNQQELVRGTKNKFGNLDLEFLGPFLFTPMYGKFGFEI